MAEAATKSWSMDLAGHVPGRGAAIPTGTYSVKVAKAEPSNTDKGNRVKFTFAVTSGEQKGRTVNAFLYIIDADFNGSDGHRSITLDNWYNLLVALKVKPGKADMRKLAAKLVGRTLAVEVKQQEPDEKGRVFSNVDDFLPAESVSSEAAEESDDDAIEESAEEIGAPDAPETSAAEEAGDDDVDEITTFDVDDL